MNICNPYQSNLHSTCSIVYGNVNNHKCESFNYNPSKRFELAEGAMFQAIPVPDTRGVKEGAPLTKKCPACNGKGVIIKQPSNQEVACMMCYGFGKIKLLDI